jgi:hypothetical protein
LFQGFPKKLHLKGISSKNFSDPSEIDFVDFRIDFLGEYDAKGETALGCELGP